MRKTGNTKTFNNFVLTNKKNMLGAIHSNLMSRDEGVEYLKNLTKKIFGKMSFLFVKIKVDDITLKTLWLDFVFYKTKFAIVLEKILGLRFENWLDNSMQKLVSVVESC